MKILLTGGSGRLGTELKKHISFLSPTISEMDITSIESIYSYCLKELPDMIVHAAAYTDVSKSNVERDKCFLVNVLGTENIVKVAKKLDIPLIYISTDYVFDGNRGMYAENDITYPVQNNFYAYTKHYGEIIVRQYDKGKVVRTSFKPSKWEYDKAFNDVYTSADYVDVIAKEIAMFISVSSKIKGNIFHIATERKSIYELAKRRNPDVKPNSRHEIKNVTIPEDVSLNIDLWNKIKQKIKGVL